MELNMPELFDQNPPVSVASPPLQPTHTHTPSQTDKTSIIAYARLCNREIQMHALTDVCAFTHHPAFLLACIYSNVFFILQRDSFQMY